MVPGKGGWASSGIEISFPPELKITLHPHAAACKWGTEYTPFAGLLSQNGKRAVCKV